MSPYERVLQALEERGFWDGTLGTGNISAHCSAHDDNKSSLSVSEGVDGNVLIHCHAGCDFLSIIHALGLTYDDVLRSKEQEQPAEYVYQGFDGRPVMKVQRLVPKSFRQYRLEENVWVPGLLPSTPRLLYHLPEVTGAGEVWVVEGEKDADALRARGVVATCNSGGAGSWRDSHSGPLRGKDVKIIADLDEPGRKHAETVRRRVLEAGAKSAVVIYPGAGKDASDHLEAGLTLADFSETDPTLSYDVFEPLDWRDYEVEKTEWLLEPYVPRNSRVLVFGPAGSLKSLWALWLGAKVAQSGGRIAFFSMEMRPSDLARRLRRLSPDSDRFKVFTRFNFESALHREAAITLLKGYDLIVVDSWTAAYRQSHNHNDGIANLDTDFFQPLLDGTGATLLILDNVGNPKITSDGEAVRPSWARGASAKTDKMDVCLQFSRPDSENNYRVHVSCTKMRYDKPMPAGVTVETPHDEINFYLVKMGARTDDPMWPGDEVEITVSAPRERNNILVEVAGLKLGVLVGPGVGADTLSPVGELHRDAMARRARARAEDRLRRFRDDDTAEQGAVQ